MSARAISLIIVLTSFLPIQAHANSWRILSEQGRLEGKVVVESGEIQEFLPPVGVELRETVYEMGADCLLIPGYYGISSYETKAALLLMDSAKTLWVAVFDSGFGSLSVDVRQATLVVCPY